MPWDLGVRNITARSDGSVNVLCGPTVLLYMGNTNRELLKVLLGGARKCLLCVGGACGWSLSSRIKHVTQFQFSTMSFVKHLVCNRV